MKKKSLIETNPHLRNTKKYRKAMIMNVASSVAIETCASVESTARMLTAKESGKRMKKSRDSDRKRGVGLWVIAKQARERE